MPQNYDYLQTSFQIGQISRRTSSRVELKAYRSAVKKALNWIPLADGPIVVKPGSLYQRNAIAGTFHRLIPFWGTLTTQGVAAPDGFLELSSAGTGRIIFQDNNVADLDYLAGGGPMAPDGWRFTANNAHPYTTAEKLFNIRTYMTKYGMVLLHPDVPPLRLTTTNGSNWFLDDLITVNNVRSRTDEGKDRFWNGPWQPLNKTATTLTPAAVTGTGIVVTASDDLFFSTDVGRQIRISNPGSGLSWGWGFITTFTDSKNVKVDIVEDFAALTATPDWQLGAFSDTSGWPRTGFRFQGRTMLFATHDQPGGFYGSEIDNRGSFQSSAKDGTVTDADGFAFEISESKTAIVWGFSNAKGVIFGNGQNEYSVNRDGSPITPLNIQIQKESNYGNPAEDAVPMGTPALQIGTQILFLQREGFAASSNFIIGRKIRYMDFNFVKDHYESPDISYLFEGITSGVNIMAWQPKNKLLWITDIQGALFSLTLDPDRETFGFAKHDVGGTDAIVEDLCVLHEELWMIVSRTVNGSTVKFIEKLTDIFDADAPLADITDAVYVDAAKQYSGPAVTTMIGLDHLEGESVAIYADGMVQDSQVVTAGAVTLAVPATKIIAGLFSNKDLELLSPEIIADTGNTLAKKKKIVRASFVFQDINNLQAGRDSDHLDEIPFRDELAPMNAPVALFTGTRKVDIEDDFDYTTTLYIRQNKPVPATIKAVNQEVALADN